MCWTYSKQKITVIVAHSPQPCTKPLCSSHSTSTEEVNSHSFSAQGPVFSLALLSFVCVAKTSSVISHVSEAATQSFFPMDDGGVHLSLRQIAELREGASKLTLFSGCLHYRVDMLVVDYFFSLAL